MGRECADMINYLPENANINEYHFGILNGRSIVLVKLITEYLIHQSFSQGINSNGVAAPVTPEAAEQGEEDNLELF